VRRMGERARLSGDLSPESQIGMARLHAGLTPAFFTTTKTLYVVCELGGTGERG